LFSFLDYKDRLLPIAAKVSGKGNHLKKIGILQLNKEPGEVPKIKNKIETSN
jgi:hypothetical protein